MSIPSKSTCRELIAAARMPKHIVAHCRQVCRVAVFVSDRLIRSGSIHLDADLVYAGALLHDITKHRSFETGENHAQTGGASLEACGYRRVAAVVRQHVCLDHYPDPPRIDEAAIVNYADKRVLHERIVGLEERMAYILERYGDSGAAQCRTRERLEWLWRETLRLERAIFTRLGFEPPALLRRMAAS